MTGDMSRESAEKWIGFEAANCPRGEAAQYLKLGHWFSNEPLSDYEREDVGRLLKNIAAFKPGECYMNSGRIALHGRGDLRFCEGLAAGIWPVPHAWIEYRGRALDVTWPTSWKRDKVYKSAITVEQIMERVNHNIANCHYFGVKIPTALLQDHVVKQRTWSPLFDARFYRRWPEFERALTTGKFPGRLHHTTHTEK